MYVRVGSTNRRADREMIEELRRFARGEAFDEQAMPDLDSEALDFRAASEFFAPLRKLKRADLETLRLVTTHQSRKVPAVGGMLLCGREHRGAQSDPLGRVSVGSLARGAGERGRPPPVRGCRTQGHARGLLRPCAALQPGAPAQEPITLASLRKGKYRPCSRNPVLAQSLSYFHRIEERGSGFRRMTGQMLDHGLDRPLIGTDTGYFQITFPGPAEDVERLRVPEQRLLVTPAVEAQLNERQRKALAEVLRSGFVASGWLVKELDVTYDTANRDLKGLAEMNILTRQGLGRAARYVLREPESRP